MKKILGVFLGVLLLVPSFSFAQTDTASSTKAQLLSSLYALLQVLENEITAIIAQQQTLQTEQQTVLQEQQNIQGTQSTPLFGSTQTDVSTSTQEISSCMPSPVLNVNVATTSGMKSQWVVSFSYSDGCNSADTLEQSPIPLSYSFAGTNGRILDQDPLWYLNQQSDNKNAFLPIAWFPSEPDPMTTTGEFATAVNIANAGILTLTVGSTSQSITVNN